MLAELARFHLHDRAILTSFDFQQLIRARELDSTVPIALLVRPDAQLAKATPSGRAGESDGTSPASGEGTLLERQKRWIDASAKAGFQMVGVTSVDLSTEVVAYARTHALEIRAWGIRSDEDMERAIALGCNGMTTNWPERLIERLVEHMGAGGGAR